MTTREKAPACPFCGSACVPIVYGLPGPELVAEYEAGRIVFGGCVILEETPSWHCRECGHSL
jgi:hypothetical protein